MNTYGTPEHLPNQNGQDNQPKYQYGYGQPQSQHYQPPTYQNPMVARPRNKLAWWQITLMIIGGFFVVLIVSGIIGSYGNRQKTAATVSHVGNTVPAIAIDYQTLYKDYMDNPINADNKYKGKRLLITGKIYRIDREINQDPFITFSIDEYGLKEIRMDFNKEEESKIAELAKEQTVTVEGTCNGTLLSTSVVLDDCVLK